MNISLFSLGKNKKDLLYTSLLFKVQSSDRSRVIFELCLNRR